MKKLLLLLIFALTINISNTVFAQGSGEIGFQNSSLSETNKVEIFPNPSTDFLNVEISNSNMQNPVIELYSIIGNAVKVELDNIAENKYRVNVSSIPAGYYLLSIKDEENRFKATYKFLKR